MKLHPPRPDLKHVAIAERMRQQIAAGVFGPGDRLPSFAELRIEYSASEDTIERVYARLENERIVVRRHRVGTFVATPGGHTGPQTKVRQEALGAMIPQQVQNDSYYTRILNGLQAVAGTADVDIVLLYESSKPRWEKVDGVIALGPMPGFPAPPPGMPIVSLLHDRREAARVFNDDEGGARQLTEHLLHWGHTKIAHLHAALLSPLDWEYGSNNIAEARIQGYRETLHAAGVESPDEWLRPLLTVEDRTIASEHDHGCIDHRTLGRIAMQRWIRQGWREMGCTALLAQNDLVAIGAIEALREAGYRVPEDVSVVGFDGHPAGEYFTPQLTTVIIPLETIAARGAELLLRQIRAPLASRRSPKKPSQTESTVFSGTLKIGASSARKMH